MASTTSLLPAASVSASPASLKSSGENFVQHIPAEVRKICVDHSTGETVLHKAARLGYLVTYRFTFYFAL